MKVTLLLLIWMFGLLPPTHMVDVWIVNAEKKSTKAHCLLYHEGKLLQDFEAHQMALKLQEGIYILHVIRCDTTLEIFTVENKKKVIIQIQDECPV